MRDPTELLVRRADSVVRPVNTTRRRKPDTTEAVQNHSMTVPGNHYRHHTHRLDLEDPFIREWAATVLLADPDQGIVLDRSAFYPGGGGQPPDHGVLLWGNVRTRIVGTRKGDDLYLLPAEGDPLPPAGTSVRGGLDDERRTSLMRTHSGLHVLSAIVLRDFGAPVTGGNMEPLIARMDFDLSDVPADFKQRVEDACNEAVRLNRQIDVRVLPREQAMAIPNIIRTASDLLPPDIEMVRIVDINGIDIQADGGTHVASTAMIGRIAVTKMESKGRGFRRLRIRIEDAE
jgi:misacylated tRNA(Ala) deacylase